MQPLEIEQQVKVQGAGGPDDWDDNWSLRKMLFFVHARQLDYLEKASQKELDGAADGQDEVTTYQNLIAMINDATDKETGTVDLEKYAEITKLLKAAKEKGLKGFEKVEGQLNERERSNLVDNIKSHLGKLNTQIEMQLMRNTRFTNFTYETFGITKSTLKTEDEAMKSCIRGIKGG
jgi:hypothetical protein